MRASANASRRDFLKVSAAVGGGFALELAVPGLARAQGGSGGAEVNAWVVIRPNDTVVIRVARSEMGQGNFTGLPMLVAEELECEWNRVRAEYAPPHEHLRRNRVWGSMATGGSRSTRDSHEYLRKAGATAREMLIAAAAQQWRVPASECRAASSVITHQRSGRRLRFGQVAEAASKLPPPKDVKLKDPSEWKLIGKSQRRLDTPEKVTGKPVFGVDVRFPGLLHASIAQSPVFKGKVKAVDGAAARGMRGVVDVVQLDGAVAVVADNWWRANQALKALKIEWDEGPNGNVTSASIKAFVRTGLTDPDARVGRRQGDVEQGLAAAAKTVEAEYYAPFLNHATMEPMNCTAWVRGDRVEIWVPTQNGEAALATAASAAGVSERSVEVHKTHLGGGFGRRGFQDYVRQAVHISKAVGKPVKLMWSREEDMQHGFYRPVTATRMKAGLDAQGRLVALHMRVASQSILANVRPQDIKDGLDRHALGGLIDSPYAVPNELLEFAMRNTHVPVGFWRTVFHTQNPFFRESFIDEVAHAAGRDPYEFRRELLASSPRNLGVLDAVAKAAGWGSPLPAGVHRGIAVQDSHGSWAATVIELAVSAKGEVTVRRVVSAINPGHVVNPDGCVAQVQSCVVYGLTAAFYGECTVKNGRVEQSNFHDYRMMLIGDMPKVEAVFVPTGDFWGGMGEPPQASIAPALANAIFAATGKRIRELPLKNHGFSIA